MEQLIFKAWVTDVFDRLWESTYRNAFKENFREPNLKKARIETDVLGDLRKVRNDLIHNKGVSNESASCDVLHWFSSEEKMVLRIGHVFDFLNQMGWIPNGLQELPGKGVFLWLPFSQESELREETPALVSVRPLIFEPDEFQYRYCASVVFEDGICARICFYQPKGVQMTDEQWNTMRVRENQELYVPPNTRVSAEEIYTAGFQELIQGPGIYSPPFKIR